MDKLLKEIVENRTENSKTFDIGNGNRRMTTQMGAVHYKDDYTDNAEGWKDIDLNWDGNKITKAPYELTLKGKKITIRNKKTNKTTTIEIDSIGGNKLSKMTLEKSKGFAKINNVAQDTDIEIGIENSAVKFSRIIKSNKAPLDAKFKIIGDTSLIKIKASDEDGNLPVDNTIKDGILTERLNSNREIKYPVKIDPTWQVGTGTDDAYRRIETDNNWNLTDINITVGAYNGTYYEYGGGMRFTNITIPQGATITEAYLTLRCSNTGQGATNSRISAEDVDDAPTFADNKTTFDTRWAARTTARVDWDAIPDWTLNNDYNSPEIKTVIQEIVDRGGWSSGNDIVIFWDDFEDRSTHAERRHHAYAYEGSSTYAPKLIITYGAAGIKAQINIGDNWKEATAAKINISDDWKEVVGIQQNISDTWKTVF